MVASTEVLKIIKPAVTVLGYELWGCELLPQSGRYLLRVYIDSEQGVTIEDCAKASRQISAVLDVEDPIPGGYELQISSPGLYRPLFSEAQYGKYIGQKVRIRLHNPMQGRRNFAGDLVKVEKGKVAVLVDGETFVLTIAEIEKGNLA